MSVHRGKQVPFAVWCAGWLSDGQRHFGQASCHPVFTIRCSDESVGVIHSTLDLSFGNASGKVFTRRSPPCHCGPSHTSGFPHQYHPDI